MQQYLDLVKRVLENGEKRPNRTGIDSISVFGERFYYKFPKQEFSNIIKGFPLLTTKKMGIKSIISELLWFLEGSSNERRLAEILYEKPRSELKEKRTIWTDNFEKQGKDLGYQNGELGPIYGVQWRNFNGVDQIKNLIDNLINHPFDRRHIVSAWNASDLNKMALPPCHMMFQVYVHGNENNLKGLSLQWYQRSIDTALGIPYNIASYATLLCMLCQIMKLPPISLIGCLGDTHLYENSLDMLDEQLKRIPYELPNLQLPKINNLDDILKSKVSDYKLINYKCHDKLTCKMAI